uniref:Chromosome passenger complex (CPC) protein INCENP N-terminal domain-containing protein n=1 Tax=Monopterus albus TaxID=43700 RepID=A0A3Q3IPD8_MONAL
MNSVLSTVCSLKQMFDGKVQEFISDIDNVHVVWLEEIQQEANRMFSREFNAEPELMPKTPSQKKNSRRKRVSVGRQEENQPRRRLSKGRRSNIRGPSVKSLNFIAEEETNLVASTSETCTTTLPKRTTRQNKQTKLDVAEDVRQSPNDSRRSEEVQNKKPEIVEEGVDNSNEVNNAEVQPGDTCSTAQSLPKIPSPEVVVSLSSADRLSAELAKEPEPSQGCSDTKMAIAAATQSSQHSSVRCSLKLRHSLAGLRHSMTQESVRRASRRSMLKRKAARTGNSTCSSNISVFSPVGRITRSVATNSPALAPPSLFLQKMSTPGNRAGVSRQSTKRKAPDTVEGSPTKRFSPPKKSQTTMRPNMRSFLHTVQKNQILMMTPNSLGRTAVIKSLIKHTTPMKIDPKTKERHKLEALRKKQEQEEERRKKMEEEKKKKQEELKRKRDERLRRVFEAKVKEEQREEEKKKKIEQKMAQIDEKNDKRLAEEKAKKKVAIKRQEELEQKKKLEEEAKRKKIQQAEEEKQQQELLAKKKAAEEEEQRARKLAEARKALELERERQAAAERERVEKEKALALQRELEKAAREKERQEMEAKRKALEEKRRLEEQQRLAAEEKAAKEREAAAKQAAEKKRSPQSYSITPKGSNKNLVSKNPEDYGMDQNSDDSTDDETAPKKIGGLGGQIIMKQYFNPPDLDSFFGVVEPPRLESIFYKSKPHYFKGTSSAVWHSPPAGTK